MSARQMTDGLQGSIVGGVLAAMAVALLLPGIARADSATEVDQGQALAESISSGETDCSDLADSDFELIGEYAMDRFIGDQSAHETMNAQMARMMGPDGEEAMHVALGHRYTACSGGPEAAWAMPMAGMMGGGFGGPGMMGGASGQGGFGSGMMDGYGPGMMGSGYPGFVGGPDDDDEISVPGAVVITLGAALLGGLIVLAGTGLLRRSRRDTEA